MPGDRLGHYELLQYVGGGGMGRVFRAIDTRLARTVALKILPPDQAVDEETLLRFQNEAQSAARLDHPNIARVHYVGEDKGLHYIVFEFIEGVNVRALVERKGSLPLAEAVSYTLQVAEALTHAAGREVVHRDVKPSNVLITPAGYVKLIDMGLARLRREGTSAADLTASGVTLGTFDYISPEQARDPRNADVRSDIYSLGCTFFYMLAGRPPFPEGTVLQKLLQHQGDQPPDVRQFRPELPEDAARIVRKMLAKDPRHRYRDPAELVEDLLVLAEHVGLRPGGPGGGVWVVPRESKASFLQRHLPWIAPIAVLVCIVLLLDFFWSSSGSRVTGPPELLGGPEELIGKLPEPTDIAASIALGTKPAGPPGSTPKGDASDQSILPDAATAAGATAATESHADPATDREHQDAEPPAAHRPDGLTETNLLKRLLAGRSGTDGLGLATAGGGLSPADPTSPMLGMAADGEPSSGGLTGAATELPNTGPIAEPVRPQAGLLVVNERTEGENEFPTLGAACSAAINGDVIELRYNGSREEQPIKLANLKITIRAGEKFHPVVVFRPTEMDPVKYPRSMFTLTAGRLTLINLALELHVPRELPAESWSLFETRGGQTIRLEKCRLSIRNASESLMAYHQDVAFFRAKSAPGAEVVIGDDNSAAAPLATIDLLDCVARGEAVLVRSEHNQPVHLVWDNGLLVTTEQLLSACNGQDALQPGGVLQIDLKHVTALLHGGLCLTTFDSHPLHTKIRCADSILVGAAGAPLIEQVGAEDADDLRRQITFAGDRNFYKDFDTFWIIRNPGQDAPLESMDFNAWRAHWGSEAENLPKLDQVSFKRLPDADRPLHSHTPADYLLSDSKATPNNPALGAASDGSNAGMQPDRLPQWWRM